MLPAGMRPPARPHRTAPTTAAAAALTAAVVALGAAVIAVVAAPAVRADPDLDALERERDAREAEVDELAADEDAARERLAELEEIAGLAVEEYHVAVERREDLEAEASSAAAAVARAEEQVAAREAEVGDLVRSLYKGEAVAGHAALLAAEPRDAARQLGYLTGAQRTQRARLDSLVADRAVLAAEQERLAWAEAAAEEAADEAERARAEAERHVAAQADEVAELTAALAAAEEAADAAQARVSEERERREREEREAQERAEREAQERAEQEAQERAEQQDVAAESADASGDAAGDSDQSAGAPVSSGGSGGGASAGPSGAAEAAVEAALSRTGSPYQWGATGPNAFDCSGLTSWAWAQAGVQIPRSSRAQYSGLPNVARSELRPGDLVFFGNPIHHVGMYIGGGTMVEAPYSGQTVRTRSINRPDYAGAARPGG